jgi:cytochrome c oxidase subunit 4
MNTHDPSPSHGLPPEAAAHGHGHEAEPGEHGHGGIAKYIYVFVALCVLTSASFFTYSDLWPFHDTPAVGWAFMMAVSCTKAMLVILFFMHVKYEANWKYVLTIPASIMAIFLGLALVPDIGLRYYHFRYGRTVSDDQARYMGSPRAEAAVEHAEPDAGH